MVGVGWCFKAMRIFILLLLTCISLSAGAEIYKWVDADGVVHYSSRAADNAKTEDVTRRVKSLGNFVSTANVDTTDSGDQKNATAAKSVTMLSASRCKVCKQAKAYLNSIGVRYTDLDVEKDPRGKKRFHELGGKGVPIILVGSQRMDGFSEGRLQQMLKTAGIIKS